MEFHFKRVNKLYLLPILFLAIVSCKKTIVQIVQEPNREFELNSLLYFNNKPCLYDSRTQTLKFTITENLLGTFEPFVQFDEDAAFFIDTFELNNGALNNLQHLDLYNTYTCKLIYEGEVIQLKLVFVDVPIIHVTVLNNISNGQKVKGKLNLFYPDQTFSEDWIGIEHRGKTSLTFDKKSFGIRVVENGDLDVPKSVSYFDFKYGSNFVLNACFVDVFRLRNKMSMQLWQSLSMVYSPKNELVELFVNASSFGIYTFGEKYTADLIGFNIDAQLIEGLDNSVYTKFEEHRNSKPKGTIWNNVWEKKLPLSNDNVTWKRFIDFSDFVVNSANLSFRSEIASYIDLQQVQDYFLFINLVMGSDNLGKNYFFYASSSNALYRILPWDLDGTFGRDPFGNSTPYDIIITNNLFRRLLDLSPNDFSEKLKIRWQQLRQNQFSFSNLEQLIDANSLLIEKENYVQKVENNLWNSNLNITLEKMYIKNWLQNRLNYLDNYFN